MNQSIQRALLKVLQRDHANWPRALPGVIFAINTAKHASTQFSPFFLMHGWNATHAADLVHQDEGNDDAAINFENEADVNAIAQYAETMKRKRDEVRAIPYM